MSRYPELILANRAYVDHEREPSEGRNPARGAGGLLEAVRPVIRAWDGATGTTWIGAGRGRCDRSWVDDAGRETLQTAHGPLRHRRLLFDDATWEGHYLRTSNEFLWPLMHLVSRPLPELVPYYPRPAVPGAEAWAAYEAVNRAFAEAAADESRGGTCWVHDYQLGLVPALLRERGFGGPVGFFLHTRAPATEICLRYLDDRGTASLAQWLRGILGADIVGVQTPSDGRRLAEAAARLCGAEPRDGGVVVEGRSVAVRAFPVGIDCQALEAVAREAELPAMADEAVASGLPLVVGLERADYTKGIPERLESLRIAIERGARFAYIGASSPTRAGVAGYDALARAVDGAAAGARAVARERGLPFTQATQALAWPEVVALMREAAVVFTSSLADGMNLVPLQTVMAQAGRDPARRGLVLAGRDAGVCETFAGMDEDGLVAVDPLDPGAMAEALMLALAGKPGRISERLIEAARARDAEHWGAAFLDALAACSDA